MPADVRLVPIRHHSPACAWHLARLIAALHPRAVLIEGPADATALIPTILDPETRAPVAVYTTWADTEHVLGRLEDRAAAVRFAAYYPLADYSPELVALRSGQAIGAALRFVDLPFPALVVAEHGPGAAPEPEDGAPPVRSLLDEHYFQHSRFLDALAERTGTRDADDLWDHLYESHFRAVPTDTFFAQVETYCALAREGYSPAMLKAEGHLAREAAMAAAVAAEAAAGPGTVLVVTGGFHTPGLRARLSAYEPPAMPARPVPGEAHTLLMRYGFAQLDRLNGYASGMQAPAWYQAVWEEIQQAPEGPAGGAAGQAAAEFVVALGRASRARGPGLSAADEIAALDQAGRLASFRGHAGPTREDLLDGIRSACVKGSAETEGRLVLDEARRLLAGDRVGEIPAHAGVAPLVLDFRRAAAHHKLDLRSGTPREVALDLYRRPAHRALSRTLWRLDYLGVPFARRVRGPDFVRRRDLDRQQEVWRYGWTPDTETALTERALYGGTLEEASAARLGADMAAEARAGGGKRADAAAAVLVQACRMGLPQQAARLLEHTAARIAEDSAVDSLITTAEQLLLLHISREPLETGQLPGLPETAAAAYERACYLLADLGATPPEGEAAALAALNAMTPVALALGDALGGARAAALAEIRRTGLRALLAGEGSAALRGGAAGALYADGAVDGADLVPLVAGHLDLHGPAFLRGLLATARACLWQVPALHAAVTTRLAAWPDADFLRLLPDLRLAFSALTASECDRLARAVAGSVGAALLPPLRVAGASEADLLLGATLDARVRALLEQDGLAGWLAPESPVAAHTLPPLDRPAGEAP